MPVAPHASMTPSDTAPASYVLPIRAAVSQAGGELTAYLHWLAGRIETIVVDGSPPEVFAAHAAAWGGVVRHLAPAPELVTPMGKVGGVLTGVRAASHERVVVADDDVRYDERSLGQVLAALDDADVVRPQNYFVPMPWHARLDTGRMLLNRMTGGDWPGTLGLRRSLLRAAGGYDGRAMFENLELVRTVQAMGGREAVLLDAFVLRRPATTTHFWSQRVRQAYDELARPARLTTQLALLPLAIVGVVTMGWPALAVSALAATAVAELGRRRAGGRAVFPASGALLAPVWLAERAVCSWLALGARVLLGGVPYRGRVLRHAATPVRVLRSRLAPARQMLASSPPDALPRRSA